MSDVAANRVFVCALFPVQGGIPPCTDGDMLWYGSKEDGNVRSECVEDEGTDCEDGDSDTGW